MRNLIEHSGLDRVENFMFFAWAVALFLTTAGFWFGIPVNAMTAYYSFGISLLLAAITSLSMAIKVFVMGIVCLIFSMYTFSYCGIDASVCHVPMQRLLNEGWNPIFQGTVEDVIELTGRGVSIYHTLCMPKTVQLTGAIIAKATGLYVADTCVHYFLIYVAFASAYRFAKYQWDCNIIPATIFGGMVAMHSQIGTMMGSAIDYPQYSCMASGLLSAFTWWRTRRAGDMFLSIACFAFAITMKPQGFFFGMICLFVLAWSCRQSRHLAKISMVVGIFVLVTGACPYLTNWVRYGSPFYPTHSFNPSVALVNITEDFTSNPDGASMGYFSRIIYAWFSTKLACLGCSLMQGKESFNPEFYVPIGVDGLKTWFRVLMWFAFLALIFSRKNRITVLCVIIFVLMNVAPLKYIGFGRYFMLIWLIPPLAIYNLIYNPCDWIKGGIRYAKWGIYAIFGILALMISVKTTWLWLRAIGLEGTRQILFNEAKERCISAFDPDKPMREFGIRKRYFICRKEGGAYTEGTPPIEMDSCAKFDTFMYMPVGLSISQEQANIDFPRCDVPRQFVDFAYGKLFSRLPCVLWE